MKTINRIVLACATLGIAPAYANIMDVFKEALVGHAKIMTEDRIEIEYWQQELNPDIRRLKRSAKINALSDIAKSIRERENQHKEYVHLNKHKNSLLTVTLSKLQDPELGVLREVQKLLKNNIKRDEEEQALIEALYLPKAMLRYSDYEQALDQFDIHWLKKHKRSQKLNNQTIEGFNELYEKRHLDLKALRQGYTLNKRDLQEQANLLETNRGIDPMSQIKIGYGDTVQDISVARYEQNKLGAPDMYIIQ